MMSDLKHAVRVIGRNPWTSGLAILTLALGVGAATSIHAVVQGVVLRDLPYPQADRLVLVWQSTAEDVSGRGPLSPRDLLDLSGQATAFSHIAGVNSFSTSYVPETGFAEQVSLGVVTGDFFGTAGVRAQMGRVLEAADDRPIDTRDPDAVSVVVLSHGFWARQLGGDPEIVGRTLRFGGSRMMVVGVMPENFAVYMPAGSGMSTALVGWTPLGVDNASSTRDGAYLKVWARLAPGVTREMAQAQLDAVAARLRAVHVPHAESGLRLRAEPLEREVIAHAWGVLMLLALTGFVTLLVACLNVAGLLLVQFMGRLPDVSVRRALGASRARIVRQLTVEAAVLSLLGAALGSALAVPAVPLLLGLDPGLIPKTWAIRLDAGVAGFALLTFLFTTVLSGLLPAFLTSRARVGLIVRSRVTATRGSRRMRSVAAAVQIAGALLLVHGSISLAKTLVRWHGEDYGFRTEGVHTLAVSLPFVSYRGPESWVRFYDAVLRRLAELPDVSVAAAGSDLPMAGDLSLEPWQPSELAGLSSWGERTALHRSVTPGYFAAAGIDVIEGRVPDEADREGSSRVAVVDEALARQLRRERPGPVTGRQLDVTRHVFAGGYSVERARVQVIGVVATVPHDHPDSPPPGMIYLPHTQYPLWSMVILLRGENGRLPDPLAARAALATLDPQLPVFMERSLRDVVLSKLAPTRFVLALVAWLTIVVATLAGVGLFGVIAESVRQGRRELGIRLALGAPVGRVIRGVLMGGAGLLAAGVVTGAALSPLISRLIADTIQTRESWSPDVLATAVVLVFALGLLSCYLPARRAGRINPNESLRAD